MHRVVLVLAIAGCGGSAATTRTGPTNTPPEPKIEDPAIARWRSLELTGADFREKLDALDVEDDVRAEMARALLRAGDFACKNIDVMSMCGDEQVSWNPLDPAATFDDPCLRRELALWSVEQLQPEDAEELAGALIEMVKLPEPETELQDAAFSLVFDEADSLRLRLMEATDPFRAAEQAWNLFSDEAIAHAANALHLDTAVERLTQDPEANHDALLIALGDTELLPETRSALMDLLGEATDAGPALVKIANEDEDCLLAEAAAEALEDRGDKSHLPSKPKTKDLNTHLRALCMLAQSTLDDRDTRLAAWIGPRGVDTVDYYDDVYWNQDPENEDSEDSISRDGDTTVETHGGVTITTTHVAKDDVDPESVLQPFYDRADLSGWACDEQQCEGRLTVYWFDTKGKSTYLGSVKLESYSGDDC